MATLGRRIVTQFCRDLEGELVLERHRHQLEQPQNDILGRRAPGNGPEDIPLPAIDLYTYIGGDYRRISVETVGTCWSRFIAFSRADVPELDQRKSENTQNFGIFLQKQCLNGRARFSRPQNRFYFGG